MSKKKFSEILLLVVGEDKSFKYYHMNDSTKTKYKSNDGKIFHVDLTKSYQLHGWVPWKDWNWWSPWSIIREWMWKVDHKVAMLIYPDGKVDEKSGMIEPISTFEPRPDDYEDMTPRGFEGFIESRIPINYFKKWTTGGGRIAWYVWVLIAVLIVVMFYFLVLRRG